MRSTTIQLATVGAYATVASLVFAITVAETIFLYPNMFRGVPESLALSDEFMTVVDIGAVMRPMGMVMTLCAVIAIVVALWARQARGWIAASLIFLIGGQFLSVLYQWPRASIFGERDQHTVEELERAVTEFLVGHGFRIAASLAAAVLAIAAVFSIYRARVLAGARANSAAEHALVC
ncbi:DUF1772 domain-containing protein [Nocardia iowensis]|uniref:DUF1772 domain-containing protein n=1 Tax=Nocardia iowensis TaxID=204891 RepID=A0ABX8RN72_NOCIO|nr:DUF1772 domain-containing protein [Nocardia iowensis]QXN88846.1 DUF1772 domain-containing protein [Nocardia iowensis]